MMILFLKSFDVELLDFKLNFGFLYKKCCHIIIRKPLTNSNMKHYQQFSDKFLIFDRIKNDPKQLDQGRRNSIISGEATSNIANFLPFFPKKLVCQPLISGEAAASPASLVPRPLVNSFFKRNFVKLHMTGITNKKM